MADTTTPEPGLRERKKRETRRQIRTVALDLALEHGPENLTVETIAHHADISPRTFFNYFDHKDDALVTDAVSVVGPLARQIVARPEHESPFHAIRAALTEDDFFALMSTDPDRMLARQRLVSEHPTLLARQLTQHAHLERAIAEATALRLDTDVDADLRATLIAGVAGSAMRIALRWWSTHWEEDPRGLLETAFDMLEQGLLTQPTPTPATAGPTAGRDPSPDE